MRVFSVATFIWFYCFFVVFVAALFLHLRSLDFVKSKSSIDRAYVEYKTILWQRFETNRLLIIDNTNVITLRNQSFRIEWSKPRSPTNVCICCLCRFRAVHRFHLISFCISSFCQLGRPSNFFLLPNFYLLSVTYLPYPYLLLYVYCSWFASKRFFVYKTQTDTDGKIELFLRLFHHGNVGGNAFSKYWRVWIKTMTHFEAVNIREKHILTWLENYCEKTPVDTMASITVSLVNQVIAFKLPQRKGKSIEWTAQKNGHQDWVHDSSICGETLYICLHRKKAMTECRKQWIRSR